MLQVIILALILPFFPNSVGHKKFSKKLSKNDGELEGATTLNILTFSIMTLSKTTFSITTLSIILNKLRHSA